MVDFNRRRAEKQPLTFFSAGSTFKRPEGAFAAQLIDECGFEGARIGGAQVSEKHAGFLSRRHGFTLMARPARRLPAEAAKVKLSLKSRFLAKMHLWEQV